jgi:F0F1-type ATP synthase membrane subunit b/b'
MNRTVQQLLEAFEALPEPARRQVAHEICGAQYKALIDKASAAIQELMEEARKNAARMVEVMLSKAVSEIQAERQRFMHDIEFAQDQAIQRLMGRIRDL